MRQVILVFVTAFFIGGCATKPKLARKRTEPTYVEGFMDGYRSAHPHQPYVRDASADYPTSFYGQGWKAGNAVGNRDKEPRE